MQKWLEQYKLPLMFALGGILSFGIIALAVRWQPSESITIIPPPPTATPGPMRVYIKGAVINPDVYVLPAGSILDEILPLAGGVAQDADLSQTNLAQVLHDGDQIYIPHIGELALVQADGQLTGGLININTASQAQLESLPGIGPSLAQRIIQYREQNGTFSNIDELQNVAGIGPAKFDGLKEFITIE